MPTAVLCANLYSAENMVMLGLGEYIVGKNVHTNPAEVPLPELEEYFKDWTFPACVPSEGELKKAMERAGFSEILIREDETAFSFPAAQKLFDHFKSVGYARYAQRLPEDYKEVFLQKILQDIEEDYRKNKTQRCKRWFAYGRKKEGAATQ